ncbi:MAG: enoyl-CoA hydratase-related protein [Gammaproteobacteria bacterium]|jgi:2-(1,2-epoxy-1,2-dihydrophenyl)acetyl-CoA isomerase|nr:enoyl-CoA hydratase-related protein [Gammaproteobacteria bacterium]
MSDSVLNELEDGVLTVTLNEPDIMNALSPGISNGLYEAVGRASSDDDVRVMVLTGAGRGFCAGAMLGGAGGEGATPSRSARLDRRGGSGRMFEAFAACEVPIIAAINGPAAGAGFGIATCCDIRFMAESARIGSIFIKRGLASDYGAAYWLPRIVGMARAYEIMYDGNLLTAERCLELGLANRVVPDDELLSETQAYARTIAQGPPLAYTTLRRMLMRATDMELPEFSEYEWTNQAMLLSTKDNREGFQAFVEKRDAKFTGE